MRWGVAEVWLLFIGPGRWWRGGEMVGQRCRCAIKSSASCRRGDERIDSVL
jgi:hypothetical protein